MRHWFTLLLTAGLDLLFPIECLGCHREDVWLCSSCAESLPRPKERCVFCLGASPSSETCQPCRSAHALDGLSAWTIYRHPVTEAIVQGMKYRFWSSIAPTLAEFMARALDRSADGHRTSDRSLLVPIPLHRTRERFRGFNQASLLSSALSDRLGLSSVNGLVRIRLTKAQATLPESERTANVHGAFAARSGVDFSGKNVILVDDVSTTGATLDAAAQVCRSSGARSVWAVAFARGSLSRQ